MSTKIEGCQICGEGQLQASRRFNTVEYKGKSKELLVIGSVCTACGSEQANAAQSRENKRAMQAFKKEVEKLLTGAEIREFREQFGITQSQAAKIFGGGPVAFSKYEADDVSQSEPMDKLLRVSMAVPSAFVWLCHQAGEATAGRHVMSENLKQMQKSMARDYRSKVFKTTSTKSAPKPVTLQDTLYSTDDLNFLEAVG